MCSDHTLPSYNGARAARPSERTKVGRCCAHLLPLVSGGRQGKIQHWLQGKLERFPSPLARLSPKRQRFCSARVRAAGRRSTKRRAARIRTDTSRSVAWMALDIIADRYDDNTCARSQPTNDRYKVVRFGGESWRRTHKHFGRFAASLRPNATTMRPYRRPL